MQIAFIAQGETPERWLPALRAALPSDRFVVWPELGDPAAIDIALVAKPPPGVLGTLPNLKLIHSLWMGVEGLLADTTVPVQVPLARMIDPGMIAAMSETVIACVLDWHRLRYRYRTQQAEQRWKHLPQFLAAERSVGILGLGELGTDAARKLVALGFRVCGWSRRQKDVEGVDCHSGPAGLAAVISRSDALVCLLPLTAETRGIVNARTLAQIPEHACVINVARGAHIVEADLLAALDSGRLAHAYLDVFNTEPLPETHPFWRHPGVTVTPHVAALTEPRTAIPRVVENIERTRRGEAASGLVDRSAGY